MRIILLFAPLTLLIIFFINLNAFAARLVSDGTTAVPPPTHCAFYFDNSTIAERSLTTLDDDGLPRCDFDLSFIQPGTHTVQASFQIDDPIWGIEEGPLSDPFEFTRPVLAEGLPAPVLSIKSSIPSSE